MDFHANVNDNDSERDSAFFKMSMGKQTHPMALQCARSAKPDQGTVSNQNHYDQKSSNRQADARPAPGQ
jgi:hypothetical protein